MKRSVFYLALFALLGTGTAFASTYVVKFQYADQTTLNATFDDAAMSYKNDKGQAGKYTFDEATKKLCGVDASGTASCVTLGGKLDKVGDTVPFSDNDGKAGTATLTAKN